METSVQVATPLHQSQCPVTNLSMDRAQQATTSPARLAKLPPISSQVEHPSSLLLHSATTELKHTMQHLLTEVKPMLTVHGKCSD